MTVQCNTPSLPIAQSPTDNWLKTLRKWFQHIRTMLHVRSIARHAPPLDRHLRRDIGLPEAEPVPDRYLVDWKDPLSVEVRRCW